VTSQGRPVFVVVLVLGLGLGLETIPIHEDEPEDEKDYTVKYILGLGPLFSITPTLHYSNFNHKRRPS
jgi:hypothetical protein